MLFVRESRPRPCVLLDLDKEPGLVSVRMFGMEATQA
jgi:hypothetical protein